MEYVEGQTINDYAASHPSEVIELFLKVCSAVQFAHQNPVIHRDLKPSNILRQPRPHLLAKRLTIQALAR
jgi:serine/threonine protein kinase